MPIFRPIPRRTVLRGAGACLALPFLDAMLGRRAGAQDAAPAQRFIALFYPNGTDPGRWNPNPGPLTAATASECLQDLAGYSAEGIWPGEGETFSDVTVVTGINHSGVCVGIHDPSMSLSAYRGTANDWTPPEPTLDQYLAPHLQGNRPFRNLALAATNNSDIGQGHISFRAGGQAESVIRDPVQLFDTLFGAGAVDSEDAEQAARRHQRRVSVLDTVREDAQRLEARVGTADRLRLEQYFEALHELEQQINAVRPDTCVAPDRPSSGGNWHTKSKLYIDLSVLAFACDLTSVATIQYSDSWGVHYGEYTFTDGIEDPQDWSDHFISHKLDDTDRANDLDAIASQNRTEAMRIANARVVHTSRFKVRRFSYLVNALKRVSTPTGTLLDETMAMYVSENGDGDSHARTNMPILLAGHVGGFETGRVVAAPNEPTGALHASIIRRFGLDVSSYGNPVGSPISGL